MDRWSVPSPLGAGGAGDQVACRRCSSSSSLSYPAGPISSSFLAESLALVHGLEWCHSHLKTCHFQSALFLIDSQSALALLSTGPEFFQPKSFWNGWDLSDSLSSRVALKLPAGFRSRWTSRADLLAKIGVPSLLALVIAKIRHVRYSSWKRNLYQNSPFCQIPSVFSDWPLPVSPAVNCPDFDATVTAFSCP